MDRGENNSNYNFRKRRVSDCNNSLKPLPLNFCPHAFNLGATLLCVGGFSKKNSLTPYGEKKIDWGSRFSHKGGLKI